MADVHNWGPRGELNILLGHWNSSRVLPGHHGDKSAECQGQSEARGSL